MRHLAGLEPPPGFIAKSSSDYLMERVKTFQMAAMVQPEKPQEEEPSEGRWGPAVRVTLETDAGNIEVALYPEAAPESAGSFLDHLDEGLFDGGTFFITIGDQPSLDFGGTRNGDGMGFAAFGRVTRGMDIVHAIHQMESTAPTDNAYLRGQLLNKPVTIHRAYRQP